MSYRTPYDGLPYYCLSCGLGIAEYLACEDLAFCRLESEARARKRAAARGVSVEDLTKEARDAA